MNNEKGYTLVMLALFITLLLSAALAAGYPLFKEVRTDSDSWIMDRNDYRFRKAFLGHGVDQSGTRLIRESGLYSDYFENDQGSKRGGGIQQNKVVARVYGPLGKDAGTNKNRVKIPVAYRYLAEGGWSGYRGKGYLHPLPSDQWDYQDRLWRSDHGFRYDSFLQPPYAYFYMQGGCGSSGTEYSIYNYCKGEPGINYSESAVHCMDAPVITVKDYSGEDHKLRLITLQSYNVNTNIFFEDPEKFSKDGYTLYRFKAPERNSGHKYTAKNSGQVKVLIQVKKNGYWQTVDTRILILSPAGKGGTQVKRTYRINFYG